MSSRDDRKYVDEAESIAAHAAALVRELNNQPPRVISFRQNGHPMGGCDFTLDFPRICDALLPIVQVVSALEADCIAFNGVQFKHGDDGSLSATFWIGIGTSLTDEMRQFIDATALHPRVPGFEWNLEVQPDYSHVAARAFEDAARFSEIEDGVKSALLSKSKWYFSDTCMPCMQVLGAQQGTERRARTGGILQRLRSKELRSLTLASKRRS